MSNGIYHGLKQGFTRLAGEFSRRKEFSGASLAVLAVLLIVAVMLSNQLLHGARLDLTENRLYTLSAGTKKLLGHIDEPINLYFFYSRQAAQGIPQISNYAQRVQDMLEEMSNLAGNGLNLTIIDPEPFSDAEDRAVQLGVQGILPGNATDKLYFGLAGTNRVGDTETIAFFQPDREPLLEYDLAKLIYRLNQTHKPVVGLLSTLDVQGGLDMQRLQPKPAWAAVEQLQQFFEVRNLETKLERIPDDINLLVLVHPADLPPATLYAIDQFVLKGGKALVFVDPHAEAAVSGGGEPGKIVPRQSDLSQLLTAWGVKMDVNQILLDAQYALRVSLDPAKPPLYHYALLGIPTRSLNQDDVITRGLDSINLAYPGILEPVPEAKTQFTPLISSSNQAMPIPSSRILPEMDPATLQSGFQPTGKTYVIAARLSGTVKSAFPDGPPKAPANPKASTPNGQAAENKSPPTPPLAASEKPINVVVVADTDLLSDQMWVRQQNFFGQRIATPLADNGNFLINAADNLLGSDDLISIHSRAGYIRPFARVDALRREADSQFRAKEQELQARLQDTERKLNELQSHKDDHNVLILSPEQQQAVQNFQQEQIKTRKALRDVRHQLDKDIDHLGTVLKFVNILLVPLLLVLTVITLNGLRHRRVEAPSPNGGQP